ncbi:MAG: exo-alpha-sialidase, partial [Planctomycetaceae bacterium]|nr:exo-alpha-sialidase [Planctomycetaceae bacterium]
MNPQANLVRVWTFLLGTACVCNLGPRAIGADPALSAQADLFTEAPFASCHASTLAETPQGLVAAWFAGSYEKHPDVGIWVARRIGGSWTPPVEVANGVQFSTPAGEVHRH